MRPLHILEKRVPSIQSKTISKLKTDPIIAVRNVPASSKWYQSVFSLKSKHGGTEFDILTTSEGEVALCLHRWQADHHPTMTDASVPVGNGLILYFRTDEMEQIRRLAKGLNVEVDRENPPKHQYKQAGVRLETSGRVLSDRLGVSRV